MDDEPTTAGRIDQPLGTVKKVNPDGTVQVELDMTNPDACLLVAAHLSGGSVAVNAALRTIQSRETN
jgi:predicted LPLAT superfamily acyltransferase